MIWIPIVIGVVLLAAATVLARRGKSSDASANDRHEPSVDSAEAVEAERISGINASLDAAAHTVSRISQFRVTGAYKVPQRRVTVSDLRLDSLALLEEEEIESDMATLDGFLLDVRDGLGADEVVFWRWSDKRESLLPAAWSTAGAARPQYFDMKAWGPLVQWAAEGRVVNFDADARQAVARLAAAPIEVDGRLLGVLSVARQSGLDRGREHIKGWLPRYAIHVGRLISLFELRREYGRYMRQGQALLTAAKRVQGHKSQDALCKAICEIALQVSSATDAALIRWRSDPGRGWVQYTTPGFKRAAPFAMTEDAIATRTCADGTTLLIEDVAAMTGTVSLFADGDAAWKEGTVGIIPLKLEERVIGAIVVASPRANAIQPEESRNVALLGALSAPSLEMVWEMEEVSRRANTDALTGLANRRAFDEQLETLLLHADRFGHTMSLIMVDVDHFKKVNDTHGHEAGDAVLRSLAKTLSDAVRAVDVCARFGGEEIAILLPQTALVGAVELADRLRASIAAKPIPVTGNEISVTVSCGVATYPDGALTKETLFASADRALYEAKASGRNCVKSATPKSVGAIR